MWLLFGASTAFNLTISGSDLADISGQLTAAGLLVLLVVPKVKNENLVAAATLLGSGLRIFLFVQLHRHGWLEHSTMQGATILAIAVCSVFDGVGKHLAIKSVPQLITMPPVLSLVYLGVTVTSRLPTPFKKALPSMSFCGHPRGMRCINLMCGRQMPTFVCDVLIVCCLVVRKMKAYACLKRTLNVCVIAWILCGCCRSKTLSASFTSW